MVAPVPRRILSVSSVRPAAGLSGGTAILDTERSLPDRSAGVPLVLETNQSFQLVLEAAEQNRPVLGLCVGLQLMFDEGHEFGIHRGLGLMRGRVVRFPEDGPHVPQIGWNQIENAQAHPLLARLERAEGGARRPRRARGVPRYYGVH